MKNALSLQFNRWQAPHFRPINKFYKSQKHKGKANGDEWVYYIHETLENEEQVRGAVRLVPYVTSPESSTDIHYFWLRSLYIDESLRGQGLGGQLLNYLHSHIDNTIYCFPYVHLEAFYQQAGYSKLFPAELPEPLEALYSRYDQRGEKIIAMSHHPTNA